MPTPADLVTLLERETRLCDGAVARHADGRDLGAGGWAFAGGEFIFHTGTGYGFHYRPGRGVALDCAAGADPAELDLWRSGSVYAAVACLNGLYPLHASAVAWDGRVHAFTGPSGAGKSTLVTGLGQAGFPLFCDDTLLLTLDDPERIVALPGHKRLKLTQTALALTGAQATAQVGSDTGKSYAVPPAGALREPLELASLTVLAAGPTAHLEPLRGADRFVALGEEHYTHDLYLAARPHSRAALFALRARLAQRLTLARLVRPFTPAGFAKSLELAETALRHPLPQEHP